MTFSVLKVADRCSRPICCFLKFTGGMVFTEVLLLRCNNTVYFENIRGSSYSRRPPPNDFLTIFFQIA